MWKIDDGITWIIYLRCCLSPLCKYRGLTGSTPWPLGDFNKILSKIIFKLIFVTNGCDISSEITLRWTSLDLSGDELTLVQVMAWCRQATSHYLGQCWPRFLSPYGVTRPQWVNETVRNSCVHILCACTCTVDVALCMFWLAKQLSTQYWSHELQLPTGNKTYWVINTSCNLFIIWREMYIFKINKYTFGHYNVTTRRKIDADFTEDCEILRKL